MSNFDLAWRLTLANEDTVPSGKVEQDSNGADVRYGINAAYYPGDAVFTLPAPLAIKRAEGIYLDIWDRLQLEKLANDCIAAKIFDLCFNAGDKPGIQILQRAANALGATLEVDGKVGPLTIAAANTKQPQALMDAIVVAGTNHYQAIVAAKPEDAKYLSGWLSRLKKNTEVS